MICHIPTFINLLVTTPLKGRAYLLYGKICAFTRSSFVFGPFQARLGHVYSWLLYRQFLWEALLFIKQGP